MKSGTVILDVDGTLVDSNDAHAHAWVDAFRESGITVPFGQVRRLIGMGGDKLMPAVAGLKEESDLGRQISECRGRILKARYLPEVRTFPRTRDLLLRLKADGFDLAVASSAKENELHPLLERGGVSDLLAERTSSDDAEESKPDPDILHAAMQKSGADRNRTVMIGDTPYDVEAARRAGVAIVALECGGWSREELEGAVAVYADAADLLAHYDTSPFARLRDGQHVQA